MQSRLFIIAMSDSTGECSLIVVDRNDLLHPTLTCFMLNIIAHSSVHTASHRNVSYGEFRYGCASYDNVTYNNVARFNTIADVCAEINKYIATFSIRNLVALDISFGLQVQEVCTILPLFANVQINEIKCTAPHLAYVAQCNAITITTCWFGSVAHVACQVSDDCIASIIRINLRKLCMTCVGNIMNHTNKNIRKIYVCIVGGPYTLCKTSAQTNLNYNKSMTLRELCLDDAQKYL